MNWLPNDSSQGYYAPRKILKIRTLEMPFPAIWALSYELQFDFKKGKPLCHILNFIFLRPPPCTPVDQAQQRCAPLCTPL
jgi:hypothetical protein